MTKPAKKLKLSTPAFAANLATLQDEALNPYFREQAAITIFEHFGDKIDQQVRQRRQRCTEENVSPEDLKQEAGLALWRYLVRPLGPDKETNPVTYVENVTALIIHTMNSYLDSANEMLSIGNNPRTLRKTFIQQAGGFEFMSLSAQAARLERETEYRAEARKHPVPIQAVRFARQAPHLDDDSAIFDGVLDRPSRKAANLFIDPVPGPDEQVDLGRQRAYVMEFARERLPARSFEVLCQRYGLDDPMNREMSFEAIGALHGVTREPIRQIEWGALRILKAHADRDDTAYGVGLRSILKNV